MRASARKSPRFMTTQRWVFVIVASLLLLLTGFGIYFRDIQMSKWSETSEIEEQAIEAAELASVEKVYKHVWKTESWIVEGTNQAEEDVFVWIIKDEQPKIIKATDAISSRALAGAFAAEHSGAEVKRIQPGLLNDEPVWEVYYKANDSGKAYYYYAFYSFGSGNFIDEYKLPAKTEP